MLCKNVIVRAQQENKGSAINNKHKTIDNDDNQTLYAMARDMVRALQQRFWLLNFPSETNFYLEIVYSTKK
jgi:hypothetical protein